MIHLLVKANGVCGGIGEISGVEADYGILAFETLRFFDGILALVGFTFSMRTMGPQSI